MKTTLPNNGSSRLLAAALTAAGFWMAGTPAVLAAEPAKPGSYTEKAQEWREMMSDTFRDAWKDVRGSEGSVSTASVDLREQADGYTLRLNLPNHEVDKVEVALEGSALKIVAPAGEKAGRYEQRVALPGVAPDTKPTIERKAQDNLIVVTLPKQPTGADTAAATPGGEALTPHSDWERNIFGRMERMRSEMDRIFNESFSPFRVNPQHQGQFDQPSFGSLVDLKEEGSNYVVTAYLPERDIQNVSATVEGDILKIEAKAESKDESPADPSNPSVSRKAHYSQLLTLPGPVQADKVKVERKEGMLLVTIPKA